MATLTKLTETQLDALIQEACKTLGILSYHTYDSRRSTAGFPDRVYAAPGGMLIRELKTDTGRLTPMQQQWMATLRAAGVDVGVWRPADWPHVIWPALKAIAKPAAVTHVP